MSSRDYDCRRNVMDDKLDGSNAKSFSKDVAIGRRKGGKCLSVVTYCYYCYCVHGHIKLYATDETWLRHYKKNTSSRRAQARTCMLVK